MLRALVLLAFVAAPSRAVAASCDSLASLALPGAKVTLATPVAAGAFSMSKELPAFCRVAATLAPTSDSDIKIEVWLPENWNGKFQGVGNGGWAGSISYPALMEALRRGYATASTDTGHVGATGTFALDHPEKFVDFAWRSVHVMTVAAKNIIRAYYGNPAKYSYWNGCSTGGRQGLSEAQRFPEDYDGIIAGAPANPRTYLNAWQIALARPMMVDRRSFIPPAKYPVVHKAVVAACDAIDGVRDGLIEHPPSCRFDPAVLACDNGDERSCLTAPQVESVRRIFSGARSKTGEEIFPGVEPGSELGWSMVLAGPEPSATALDQFKYVVYKDPDWDWRTFDFERDLAKANDVDNGTVNAINPDLSKFAARGGKLLLYHGWGDPGVPPRSTVNYYNSVLKPGRDAARLFMAPGMGHCRGGEGPNTFDMVAALEQWVEHGNAPDKVIASHATGGKVDRTRPLCPYPQVAHYVGIGSIDEAANFVCK